jgi:hypothetical protein
LNLTVYIQIKVHTASEWSSLNGTGKEENITGSFIDRRIMHRKRAHIRAQRSK